MLIHMRIPTPSFTHVGFFYTYILSSASLHCFMFLVIIVGVINFSILDHRLKFSAKGVELELLLIRIRLIRIGMP
jgi:hypothetical protein